MNFKALYKNLFNCFKTTTNFKYAFLKLVWLYDIKRKFGLNKVSTIKIHFHFPKPVNKIELLVRNNMGSDAFIISEVFEQECYKISLKVDCKNIIDLGANAGYTALYFTRIFPNASIVCIEPIPQNSIILRKNLLLNNANAIVFEKAIGITDGTIKMDIGIKDYSHKVHNIVYGKDIGNQTIEVGLISMPTLLKKLNWKKVDLLKIDIEGYEYILLSSNNDWLSSVNTIIMEIHEGVQIEEIIFVLEKFSFNHIIQRMGNWIFSKNALDNI